MSMLHITMHPANRLTPPPMPIPLNIGVENKIEATANRLLERLLAEKMLAAYRGYMFGMYSKTDCTMKYVPKMDIASPTVGAIQ
jgi:hypothetical protein